MKELHQRISAIFGVFAGFELVWNVLTPSNPQHVLNVAENACLLVLFCVTYFSPRKISEILHVVALSVVAFIPMGMDDSPFFGAVVAIFALILIYAYGGYQTRPWWKMATTNAALWWLCSVAMSHFSAPSIENYFRAATWVLFINVFCFVLWIVVDHRERTRALERSILDENRRLISENKRLIKEMKKLVAGCHDDAN